MLRHLSPALDECLQRRGRQAGGLALGEQTSNVSVQVCWWRVAQDGNMVDAVELEAVDGEVAVRRAIEHVLELLVHLASRGSAGEAGGPVVGLRFALAVGFTVGNFG